MAPAAAPAAGPPRIVGLNYFVRDDGTLPHVRLLVGVKHAGAPTRLDDSISGHPWVLQHQDGGKVYRLIRRSLERRGSAAVRIRARNGGATDRAKLTIRESDCTKDPPFYPLDCTIHR